MIAQTAAARIAGLESLLDTLAYNRDRDDIEQEIAQLRETLPTDPTPDPEVIAQTVSTFDTHAATLLDNLRSARAALYTARSRAGYRDATITGEQLDAITCAELMDVNRAELALKHYVESYDAAERTYSPWDAKSVINSMRVPAPTADPYANLPAIGGGSHALDTRATSQKRDNQRAERNAQQEDYHAHATASAQEIADTLESLGFQLVSSNTVGDTPVTLWSNRQATVKQTPYTVKVYNADSKRQRLPKNGDAELVNRMEHGWCSRGEATGYAAGIVAALLPLIETPDPYMQALDAMEESHDQEREGTDHRGTVSMGMDGSDVREKPLATDGNRAHRVPDADAFPIADERAESPRYTVGQMSDEQLQREIKIMEISIADIVASNYKGYPKGAIKDMRAVLKRDQNELARRDEPANAYTLATPSHEGGLQTILAVSRYDAVPAISGGSQDHVIATSEGNIIAVIEHHDISGGSQDADDICNDCGGPVIETESYSGVGLCEACADLMDERSNDIEFIIPDPEMTDDLTSCGAICQENNDRAWAKLDTKCPGFYSSQAGAWLNCTESKDASAEHCHGCKHAIKREEDHEMAMDRLDQWGR